MRRFLSVLLVATALVASAIDIRAIPAPDDAQSPSAVWERYTIAKKRFQFDLFELLSRRWSDLESTLRWQRDEQLTLIEQRNMRFRYLIAHSPNRIVTGEGLSAFSNFDWTDKDERGLRASNPDYVALDAFLTTTRDRLAADPGLDEARSRLTTLSTDYEFTDMTTRFNRFADELDTELTRRD